MKIMNLSYIYLKKCMHWTSLYLKHIDHAHNVMDDNCVT